MTTAPPRLWAGRSLSLAGVLLVAINLRTAVAALSPIFADISVEIPLDSLAIGILGTLPPLCFALFGVLAPLLRRWMRLEALLIVALAAMLVGDLGRGLSGSYSLLAVSSGLAFAGMGVGNVVLPPMVKKYFPSHIGLVTSLYATVMSLFALLPPLVAVPVSDAFGWRTSVSLWGAFSLIAIIPWVGLLIRDRRAARVGASGGASASPASAAGGATAMGVSAAGVAPSGEASSAGSRMFGRAWHSNTAWSLAVMFAMTALNTYAMFAWLPSLLTDVAGVHPAEAGAMLSLYAGMGIPASLLLPIIAVRLRNIAPLIWAGVLFYAVGYLGLLFAPTSLPWVWVAFAGLGPMLFPLSLLLINLRTRTQAGSVALSGFVQGLGYLIGAAGPLVVGVLHQLTSGWMAPLLFLLATAVVIVFTGTVVARPRLLEDDWHRTRAPHLASETP